MKPLSKWDPHEPCPITLELLDQDHDRACHLFYDYCWKLLPRYAHRVFRRVPADLWEDLITQTITHCWDNGQRVLRTYQHRDGTFAAWVLTVAWRQGQHYVRDVIKREPEFVDDADDEILNSIESEAPSELDRHEVRSRLDLVSAYIARLGEQCKLLVKYAADGYLPSEIARRLGYPPDSGKHVWDQLKACRKRLERLMKEDGLDRYSLTGTARNGADEAR